MNNFFQKTDKITKTPTTVPYRTLDHQEESLVGTRWILDALSKDGKPIIVIVTRVGDDGRIRYHFEYFEESILGHWTKTLEDFKAIYTRL